MLRNKIYYRIKPFVPAPVRMAVRKRFALWMRARTQHFWPIMPGSEVPPPGWTGWPEGKQFAFVLSHDVESAVGLEKCRALMEVEMELGFRSAFNFIPEGNYRLPQDLRDELAQNNFEVGVHDFRHDGHLFASRRDFALSAAHINHYINEWGASGFRSGFMLHNLDWLHDLDIRYDASTFDTDPFEPQPEGRHTIFPFWVAAPATNGRQSENGKDGYVELPYTLPQDSTLFLLLDEQSPEIWLRKLRFISAHGGMALVDTHPDYMCFNGRPRRGEFDISFYRELLLHVRDYYGSSSWNALPREVAAHAYEVLRPKQASSDQSIRTAATSAAPAKIWVDLDNTPHVPFFIPIIRELEKRGHTVVVTARDAFQVCELADSKKLRCLKIGRHYGKHTLLKIFGLVWRSLQLVPFYWKERPNVALSHGARSQLLLSNLFRKPTILISDYEFSKTPLLIAPRWEIVPAMLSSEGLHSRSHRVRKYHGIKEDVYAPDFRPDPALLDELGLNDSRLVVTVRPPANEAHYHNPESELLLEQLMKRICRTSGICAVMLPRNNQQERALRQQYPQWFADGKTIVPSKAVDGLNLLWYSDLVVSGGGTMNREAAALGVPVYSIFRGKIGAVDRKLEQEGRLVLVRTPAEVNTKIIFQKRSKALSPNNGARRALSDIIDHIEHIIRTESRNGSRNGATSGTERARV